MKFYLTQIKKFPNILSHQHCHVITISSSFETVAVHIFLFYFVQVEFTNYTQWRKYCLVTEQWFVYTRRKQYPKALCLQSYQFASLLYLNVRLVLVPDSVEHELQCRHNWLCLDGLMAEAFCSVSSHRVSSICFHHIINHHQTAEYCGSQIPVHVILLRVTLLCLYKKIYTFTWSKVLVLECKVIGGTMSVCIWKRCKQCKQIHP